MISILKSLDFKALDVLIGFASNRPFLSIAFFYSIVKAAVGTESVPMARRAYTRIGCRCQILFSKKIKTRMRKAHSGFRKAYGGNAAIAEQSYKKIAKKM